jgi:hypothetical protein
MYLASPMRESDCPTTRCRNPTSALTTKLQEPSFALPTARFRIVSGLAICAFLIEKFPIFLDIKR